MLSSVVPLIFAALMAAEPSLLNLTPLPHKRELEGGFEEDVAFRYGTALVTYTPPFKWAASGDQNRAVFRPDVSQAEEVIELHPKPQVTAFDPDAVKTFKADLAGTLPREAQKVEWGDDEPNQLLMNRHPTYRVVVSYSAFGQRYTSTMVVCNFANQQIRFKFMCREADFKDLYEAFRRSLYTFTGLE